MRHEDIDIDIEALVNERDPLAVRKMHGESLSAVDAARLEELDDIFDAWALVEYGESPGLPPEVAALLREFLGS